MNKFLKAIAVFFAVLVVGFVGYLEMNHYNPSPDAYDYIATTDQDNYLTFDNNSDTGFIFYPGAKVDPQAYSYLSKLDSNVYIAKFPFEMALFDSKVATQIIEENPNVKTWYIGGHSLGGVFANRFATNNPEQIAGVVFFGSYPLEGEENNLPGLALFGDQDLVVGDYTEKISLFAQSTDIVLLSNANHGGFGDYGYQKGDGELTDEQLDAQRQTIIDQVNEFIMQTSN